VVVLSFLPSELMGILVIAVVLLSMGHVIMTSQTGKIPTTGRNVNNISPHKTTPNDV
jgi:hypothetical protein